MNPTAHAIATYQAHLRLRGLLNVWAAPAEIEAVTEAGETVIVRYHATGDYTDRWIDTATGRFVRLRGFVQPALE